VSDLCCVFLHGRVAVSPAVREYTTQVAVSEFVGRIFSRV
jgi:hypothetical protein